MSLEAFGHELRDAVEVSNKRRVRYQRAALGMTTVVVFLAASILVYTSARQSGAPPVPVADEPITVPEEGSDRSAVDGASDDSEAPATTDSAEPDDAVADGQQSQSSGDDANLSETSNETDESATPETSSDGSEPQTGESAREQDAETGSSSANLEVAGCTQPGGHVSASTAIQLGQQADPVTGIAIDGVQISGFNPKGEPSRVTFVDRGFGVRGVRNDFQIDYDPKVGASEILRFDFPSEICAAALALDFLGNDGKDVFESGRWSALNIDGETVDSGTFQMLPETRPERSVEIELPGPATTLLLEATDYKQPEAAIPADDSSDFAVTSIEWTSPE